MNTPDGYQEAAKKAAERAKQNQSAELNDQIIATFRMAKAHRLDTGSGVRPGQLSDIWQAAFTDVPEWNFDFKNDARTDF